VKRSRSLPICFVVQRPELRLVRSRAGLRPHREHAAVDLIETWGHHHGVPLEPISTVKRILKRRLGGGVVRRENGLNVKESSQHPKESSRELKESSQHRRESSQHLKQSSQQVKESSQHLKESSQRRFQLKLARCGPREALERLPHRRREGVAHVSRHLPSSFRLGLLVSGGRRDGFGHNDDVE
jgi:hypothetical protein